MKRLLNVSGRHLITPYLSIGGFAGLRSAEITRLDWKNVNFDRGFIEVRADTCKTRARRLVPISDNLRAWLKPFALQSGPVVPYGNANCVVARIASHAGIKWKKNALRHSFVSYRLAATNDGAKTALEAGHNQKVLFVIIAKWSVQRWQRNGSRSCLLWKCSAAWLGSAVTKGTVASWGNSWSCRSLSRRRHDQTHARPEISIVAQREGLHRRAAKSVKRNFDDFDNACCVEKPNDRSVYGRFPA